MSTTLGTVITSARDRHPAFHRTRVSDAIFARLLSQYQSELIGRAMQRDRTFLAQQASVVFALSESNAIGTRGAGTGSFPVSVGTDDVVSRSEATIGTADELDLDGDGVTVVAEFVPNSATTTSVTKTGAAWTTNQFANDVLEVTAGTGAGQRRYLASNTSDTLTWTDALTTALDTTSVVRVVQVATSASREVGVVTAFPLVTDRIGYAVKLDSSGVSYLDLTSPLVGTVDQGIPLPAAIKHLIGGTVWMADDATKTTPKPLRLVTYHARMQRTTQWYAAYVLNRTLYVVGDATDWNTVASIDLRYVPEPPTFTALTDYLLLPDHAAPAMIAHAAYMAGLRVQGLEGIPPLDLNALLAAKQAAEDAFLREVSLQPRATMSRVQEMW